MLTTQAAAGPGALVDGDGYLTESAKAYLFERLNALDLSEAQLAHQAGVSGSTLSKIKHRLSRPKAGTLMRLWRILDGGSDSSTRHGQPATAATPATPAPVEKSLESNVYDGVIERGSDGGWPIYDGGGCGSPVAADESSRPIPVDFQQLEGDKARMVGPHGFGVRIRGESMSNWDIHDQDICWVNPDLAPKRNRPNLYFVTLPDGQQGLVVKVLVQDGDRVLLRSDGEDGPQDVPVEHATALGPIVRHDPRSRVPARREPLSVAVARLNADLARLEDAQPSRDGEADAPARPRRLG